MKITHDMRPKIWSQMVGQENVVKSLKKQSELRDFSNVYIFHGHYGSGKTTAARILAMSANCEAPKDGNPCGCCKNCKAITERNTTDYFELDAASRSSVEDARSLIESVSYCPVTMPYKVYVIDEVQRLSANAFDALLKTLEEPPKYAIFILCTTAFSSIPSTVASRATKYHFKGLDSNLMLEKLKQVSKEYNREVEEEALEVIVRHSNGSLRDAETNLEQAFRYSDGLISRALVEEMLSVVGEEEVIAFVKAILSKDVKEAVRLANELYDNANDLGSVIVSARSLLCDGMQLVAGFEKIFDRVSSTRGKCLTELKAISNDIYRYRLIDKALGKAYNDLKKDYFLETFICAVVDMTISYSKEDLENKINELSRRIELLSGKEMTYADVIDKREELIIPKEAEDISEIENANNGEFAHEEDVKQGESVTAENAPSDEKSIKEDLKKVAFSWNMDNFFFSPDVPEDSSASVSNLTEESSESDISFDEALKKDEAFRACVKYMCTVTKEGNVTQVKTQYEQAKKLVDACIEAYNIKGVATSLE